MNADTYDLQEIFRKDTRYEVPLFQRPYVWNEDEHWQLLWDDLIQVVEDLITLRDANAEPTEFDEVQSDTSPHFLGAIVLDQQRNPVGKLETREIVDGQQRLITLQILLSAAHSAAIELGLPDSAAMFEKLMYNDEDLVNEASHQLKVWPIEPDRQAFQEVMKLDRRSAFEFDGDHVLHECYQFYLDQVEEWVQSGPQSPEDRFEALITTTWRLIRVVAIELESNDDAQVIFETLNARGTPLLAADLIKNYLFREAMMDDADPSDLHDTYWKQFDGEYWREEVSQGRLERPRIDVFVMHWLTMRMAQQVRAKKLFPTFQRYLGQSNEDIPGVLEDINHYSSVYMDFSEPYETNREGMFFHRLDVLDTSTPMPVLLWIYGHDDVPDAQRVRAVEAMESWIVRRMLSRVTTKNYNNIFLDLLDELQQAEADSVGDTVVEFFRTRDADSDFWPDNETMKNAMVTKPYWRRINRRRLKMVFSAIERHLRDTGYSETLEITQTLQIEHIMPQEWGRHWPLPGSEPEEVEEIERNRIIDTVGNLTVLTDKLNPSISNSAWNDKREAIDEHTVLLVNDRLIRNWFDEWTEDTIKERSVWLADQAAEVWPGPESDYWG